MARPRFFHKKKRSCSPHLSKKPGLFLSFFLSVLLRFVGQNSMREGLGNAVVPNTNKNRRTRRHKFSPTKKIGDFLPIFLLTSKIFLRLYAYYTTVKILVKSFLFVRIEISQNIQTFFAATSFRHSSVLEISFFDYYIATVFSSYNCYVTPRKISFDNCNASRTRLVVVYDVFFVFYSPKSKWQFWTPCAGIFDAIPAVRIRCI